MAIFTVQGIVTRGRAVGRQLGFRTINLPCPENAPADGVYAALVRFENGDHFQSILNQGAPPTFPDAPRRIEAHILGDCGDRYDSRVQIDYLLYIRPQKAFESPEALSAAISADVNTAKTYFQQISVKK